jgi:hypothetical protein
MAFYSSDGEELDESEWLASAMAERQVAEGGAQVIDLPTAGGAEG